jgi:hypothetical protein
VRHIAVRRKRGPVHRARQPGELAQRERPPGRVRDEPCHGGAVHARHGEDQVGVVDELGGELPRDEALLVAAQLAQPLGRARVDRAAGQRRRAGAVDAYQPGGRSQAVRQAGVEQSLGQRRPADVAGAHDEDREDPGGARHGREV